MCRRLWPLRSDRQSVLKAAISHDKKIYSTIYNECNYLSMLWLKLNHVSNKDPRSKFNQCWSRVLCYWGVPSIAHGLALCMMTSSNGNIFRVAGTGEFPTQRPVTRSFDVYFDLRPNKRLSKKSWGWWFETQSRPLWRHLNEWGHIVLSCTSQHIHTAPMFIDLSCTGSWFIIFDFLIFSITSFRCSYSLVVALTQSLDVLVWGKVRGNVIKVPRVERLEFPRDFFSNGPWRDTGGSVHPGRHQGPLLLTWINFDPSMDK